MRIYDIGQELEIQVEDYHISYVTDTKGFYQPVYEFYCVINGTEQTVVIPAIA